MTLKSATLAAVATALAVCACAPEPEQLARARLQQGIEAMQRGDYATALTTCEQCALDLPGERSAHICRLVSAIHLQNWVAALAAAELLGEQEPESAWAGAVILDLQRRLNRPVDGRFPVPEGETGLWACLEGWCSADGEEGEPENVDPVARALLAVARGDQTAALRHLESAERKGVVPRLLALLYLKTGNRTGAVEMLPHLGCRDLAAGELGAQLAVFLQEPAFFRVPGCPPGSADEEWPPALAAAVAHYRGKGALDGSIAEAVPGDGPLRPSADLLMLRAMSKPPSDSRERLKLLEEAATADPSNAVANLNLGLALIGDHQLRKAAYYLSRARAAGTDSGVATVCLYLTRLLSGELEVASGLLQELSPSAGRTWLEWLQGLEPHSYFQTGTVGVSLRESGRDSLGGRH